MTNRQTRERSILSATVSQLYGYIYCMLVSNALLGMPMYGGCLYLCGRAVRVFSFAYGRRNRRYLPAYARKWGILLLAVLTVMAVSLTAVYPTTIENPRIWLMFAMVLLSLLADGSVELYTRVLRKNENPSARSTVLFVLAQALWGVLACTVLLASLDLLTGITLTCGFVIWLALQFYAERQLLTADGGPAEEPEEGEADISSLQAYRSFEWIGLLLMMALELTLTVLYALLAAGREEMLPAVAVGLVCNVCAAEAGILFLRRTERKSQKDPTYMLCAGLVLWLGGVLICIRLLTLAETELSLSGICAGLCLCSAGGAVSLTGLSRIERLLPDLAVLTGRKFPEQYRQIRRVNWEFARLLGDVLALLALIIICFSTERDVPKTFAEALTRFRPMLFVPLATVVVCAFVSVLNFPFSSRYIGKMRQLLQLQETGRENSALRRQVEHMATGHYRQPYLTRFIILILKPSYRHKLVHADHIVEEEGNPLVFLSNHGEFYGPIVCRLFIPVPVRPWTISTMMTDQQEITKYVYENTFSRLKAPGFVQRLLARFIGWLSMTVMHQIEAIPVYRDQPMKLRDTVRQSVDALEAGDNLLIFPEVTDQKYVQKGIGELSPGFVMLATAYWRRTGKKLRIMPVYANKEERTITFGEVLEFRPEVPFPEEQARICREAREQILRMAGCEEDPAAGEEKEEKKEAGGE